MLISQKEYLCTSKVVIIHLAGRQVGGIWTQEPTHCDMMSDGFLKCLVNIWYYQTFCLAIENLLFRSLLIILNMEDICYEKVFLISGKYRNSLLHLIQ